LADESANVFGFHFGASSIDLELFDGGWKLLEDGAHNMPRKVKPISAIIMPTQK
jgi:hypothetical protein